MPLLPNYAVLISDSRTLRIIRYNIASVWLVKDASSVFSIDSQIFTRIHKPTRSLVGGARRTACTRLLRYRFDTSEHSPSNESACIKPFAVSDEYDITHRRVQDRHADPFRGDWR